MGKKSGGTKSPVDHYRRQLGKHEKHMTTSRSRDSAGMSRASKYASSASNTKPKYIVRIGLVLAVLLVAIAVVYFVGFMGVVQLLYDVVEAVSVYWRGPRQSSSPRDKSGTL